jgi:hypothetical protein
VFCVFVDFTFSDELDFIPDDLLWCDTNDDDTGRPFIELEFILGFMFNDLLWDVLLPMLE